MTLSHHSCQLRWWWQMCVFVMALSQRIGVSLPRQHAFVNDRAGPVAESADGVYTVHIIADHSIVTVIVNNATAITAVVTPSSSGPGAVQLFGVDGVAVKCQWQAWALRDAIINDVHS